MSKLFALSLQQITSAIIAGGSQQTMLIEGHMGTGKSSLLDTVARELPEHIPCYFDCTTKDLGDVALPKIAQLDDNDYVAFATNEELGVHHDKPIILMIDEYGKANRAVQNSLLRLMLERKIGTRTLHPDSIIFATTNLGAEKVGDLLLPHARNRITIVECKKPTHMEWIEWGIANGVDHSLLGWVKDNPNLLQSFDDVRDPDENPYIYHPQAQRKSFVTPRSLASASTWLSMREHIDDATLTASLIGTIGERGALDLMAFVKLADQLPSLDSIKSDPNNAQVPTSASAVCMVVYRTLANIDKSWVDNWMTYMQRLDTEAQGLFANGVRADKYPHKTVMMTNKSFTQWAMTHNYMFAGDK